MIQVVCLTFLGLLPSAAFAFDRNNLTPEEQEALLQAIEDPGIRYNLDQYDVFVWDRSTDITKRVTSTLAKEDNPSLSDDGRWLLFSYLNLYKLDLNQMRYTPLTAEGDPSADMARWVPDHGGISFIGDLSHYESNDLSDYRRDVDIYMIEEDGKNLRRVTNTPEVKEIQYDWSPDGTKLAFLVEESGDGAVRNSVYVQSAGEKEAGKKLAEFEVGATGLAWASDGLRLYCSHYETDGKIITAHKLISINTENGEVQTILDRCPKVWDASSVDGSFLFVKQYKEEFHEGIEEKFSNVLALNGYQPRWSNSGQSIVYLKKLLPEGFVDSIKRGKSPHSYQMAVISEDGQVIYGTDVFDNQSPLVREWKVDEEHDASLRFKNVSKSEAAKLLSRTSVDIESREMILNWYEE